MGDKEKKVDKALSAVQEPKTSFASSQTTSGTASDKVVYLVYRLMLGLFRSSLEMLKAKRKSQNLTFWKIRIKGFQRLQKKDESCRRQK
jgi:hypothetical protein